MTEHVLINGKPTTATELARDTEELLRDLPRGSWEMSVAKAKDTRISVAAQKMGVKLGKIIIPTQSASPLLALTAELRNNVYLYAFDGEKKSVPWDQPGLLRTCRQLRKEATGIFYVRTTFVHRALYHDVGFCAPEVTWYRRLSATNRCLIKEIRWSTNADNRIYGFHTSSIVSVRHEIWLHRLRKISAWGGGIPDGAWKMLVQFGGHHCIWTSNALADWEAWKSAQPA